MSYEDPMDFELPREPEWFTEWVDGRLSDEERAVHERQLEKDVELREAFAAFQEAVARIRAERDEEFAAPAADSNLRARILNAVKKEEAPMRGRRAVVAEPIPIGSSIAPLADAELLDHQRERQRRRAFWASAAVGAAAIALYFGLVGQGARRVLPESNTATEAGDRYGDEAMGRTAKAPATEDRFASKKGASDGAAKKVGELQLDRGLSSPKQVKEGAASLRGALGQKAKARGQADKRVSLDFELAEGKRSRGARQEDNGKTGPARSPRKGMILRRAESKSDDDVAKIADTKAQAGKAGEQQWAKQGKRDRGRVSDRETADAGRLPRKGLIRGPASKSPVAPVGKGQSLGGVAGGGGGRTGTRKGPGAGGAARGNAVNPEDTLRETSKAKSTLAKSPNEARRRARKNANGGRGDLAGQPSGAKRFRETAKTGHDDGKNKLEELEKSGAEGGSSGRGGAVSEPGFASRGRAAQGQTLHLGRAAQQTVSVAIVNLPKELPKELPKGYFHRYPGMLALLAPVRLGSKPGSVPPPITPLPGRGLSDTRKSGPGAEKDPAERDQKEESNKKKKTGTSRPRLSVNFIDPAAPLSVPGLYGASASQLLTGLGIARSEQSKGRFEWLELRGSSRDVKAAYLGLIRGQKVQIRSLAAAKLPQLQVSRYGFAIKAGDAKGQVTYKTALRPSAKPKAAGKSSQKPSPVTGAPGGPGTPSPDLPKRRRSKTPPTKALREKTAKPDEVRIYVLIRR